MTPRPSTRLRRAAPPVALLLAACASAPPRPPHPDPCSEPPYLRLKAEEPDSLSEREFVRLRDMDEACREYREQGAARRGANEGRKGMMGGGWGRGWMSGLMALGLTTGMMLWRL